MPSMQQFTHNRLAWFSANAHLMNINDYKRGKYKLLH